jgi:glycosyltransferase involved in cell wall biosynthesis
VLVVAPEYEGASETEPDVVRVPALQHFNGSDFSVALPIPGYLNPYFVECPPDIVHSHHPHLLGHTAVRIARRFRRPLVFTHHTMYEHYLHYVPARASRMRELVIRFDTGYCNLCDYVIAPSASVAGILRERGVTTPIEIIPTGVDVRRFETGDGSGVRRAWGIGPKAFVAGYVGRLAPEKNLPFLAEAMATFVTQDPQAHFLVIGSGPSEEEVTRAFEEKKVRERLHLLGSLEGPALVNAYHAMDVFVFASYSETQGMVLTEAMAAGKPVVALDAPGVRDVVLDEVNGRLIEPDGSAEFVSAVEQIASASAARQKELSRAAWKTAHRFSMDRCGRKLLRLYTRLIRDHPGELKDESGWRQAMEEIKGDGELLKNMAEAVRHARK